MSEEAKREGMKRRVVIRIALLILVLSFFTFCDLNFDLDLPDPTLDITADIVYPSDTDISIQFSFTAEEKKHLCRYTLAKNNGTGYTVVEEGEEELVAGQVYERDYSPEGEGQYRFSFSVLVERNGSYETPPFLQDSIIFWVDSTPPSGLVSISVPGGSYNSAQDVVLNHPELDTIEGSPAQIFYTTDGNYPDSASTLYVPGEPVTVTADCTLKAVAIDLADRRSDPNSATYIIDSTPPIAPNTPTTAEGPYISKDEQLAGFDVIVGLGSSGANTGDELELLLGGSSFPSPVIDVLATEDIASDSYTFTVGAGQLGSDGTKQLTARVTDLAGNEGATSGALTLILDTMEPDPPSASPDSGTYSINEVTLSHLDWPTSISGNPVKLYYTLDETSPDASSTEYTGTSINLSDGSRVIKAVAIDEAGNASSVLIENYVIDTVAPANPSMDHSSGDYNSPFDLVITYSEIPTPSGTEVQVYYTIGSFDSPPADPDLGSTSYTASISIDRNTIVKAIAIDEAGNASTVVSRTFTFLRIDSVNPSACSKSTPINNSILYGFFFDYTAVDVFISDETTQKTCYPYLAVSSVNELHIQILGSDLTTLAAGPGTLTVVNQNNGDSVSTPITIDP